MANFYKSRNSSTESLLTNNETLESSRPNNGSRTRSNSTESIDISNITIQDDDIRVIVSIDFGTTFSGFAYANVFDNIDHINDKNKTEFKYFNYKKWGGNAYGNMKTNTVLRYDSNCENVLEWGARALRMSNSDGSIPVELFKLTLGDLAEELMPVLPEQLHSEKEQRHIKAIVDYLQKMTEPLTRNFRSLNDSYEFFNTCKNFSQEIKRTIENHWPGINIHRNIRLILTIPAETSHSTKQIMRECAFKAGLIAKINTDRLQFITEPEAAAIYCISQKSQKELIKNTNKSTFLIVDCGGGTVDLTVRELLSGDELALGEVTERTGDYCGSTFIDREFLKFLGEIIGSDALKYFKTKCYGEMKTMIDDFCTFLKFRFTGETEDLEWTFDLHRICPGLKDYIIEKNRSYDKWMIKVTGDHVKKMFDPIIERIIRLINLQLENSPKCSIIFVVGGFSESEYLQKRIKEEFEQRVKYIVIPPEPTAAVVNGAVIYGLTLNSSEQYNAKMPIGPIIKSRVLKYTYGTDIKSSREFCILAKKGTIANLDQKFEQSFKPFNPSQTAMNFNIYITKNEEPKYCNEDGIEFLGKLEIDLPDFDLGLGRKVTFSLCFAEEEIKATAINLLNGQNYHTTFTLLKHVNKSAGQLIQETSQINIKSSNHKSLLKL
ncbi:32184_t:CDS:10, partial [Gigaspora margarita]